MGGNDSIFDYANIFGYQSPFGKWTDQQTGVTSAPPKITSAYSAKPLFTFGYTDQTMDGPIPIVVYIWVEGYTDKIEVELNSVKVLARPSISKAGAYEAHFNVNVPVPYKQKDYEAKISLYNPKTKTICDIRYVTIKAKTDNTIRSSGFGNKFQGSDISTIEFHVFSGGRIEKRTPKTYNTKLQEGIIKYFYHDAASTQHFICETDFHFVEKRKNGVKISSVPSGHINTYDYPTGGNAQKAYVYSNGDIVAKGTVYGIRKYPKDTGFVQLIRMPDKLNFREGNVKIIYKFGGTKRRYCNPETMAGFIGALAQTGYEDIVCNGMCFADSTSYPSVTHPNGDSADTAYLNTLAREQVKVSAFHTFHFTKILRGNKSWYPQLTNTSYADGHNDHLHAGDFDSSKVIQLTIN